MEAPKLWLRLASFVRYLPHVTRLVFEAITCIDFSCYFLHGDERDWTLPFDADETKAVEAFTSLVSRCEILDIARACVPMVLNLLDEFLAPGRSPIHTIFLRPDTFVSWYHGWTHEHLHESFPNLKLRLGNLQRLIIETAEDDDSLEGRTLMDDDMPSFRPFSQLGELHCVIGGSIAYTGRWYTSRQTAATAPRPEWEGILTVARSENHVVHLAPLTPVQLGLLRPRMPEGAASSMTATATQPLFSFVGDFTSTKSYISETFKLITAARFPDLEVLIYDIPVSEPDLPCPPDFCGKLGFRTIRIPARVAVAADDTNDNNDDDDAMGAISAQMAHAQSLP